MRSLKLAVPLCVLMVVGVPSRAHAWFEWLEYLSGPGAFWGGRVDVRFWCAGENTKTANLRKKVEDLKNSVVAVRPPHQPSDYKTYIGGWTAIVDSIVDLNSDAHALSEREIGLIRDASNSISESDFNLYRANAPEGARRAEATPEIQPVNSIRLTSDLVDEAIRRFEPIDISISATAIFISLCDPGKNRTWALEGGSSLMGAVGVPGYAQGHAIGLVTYTGAITFRPAAYEPRIDFVDLGLEAGAATFFSGGFDTFSTMLVEPFVDVHFPSTWAARGGHRAALSRFSARVGAVFFPQGFDVVQQFAATTPRHIDGSEHSLNVVVYYNLKKQKPDQK